jgi:hypothetical protein
MEKSEWEYQRGLFQGMQEAAMLVRIEADTKHATADGWLERMTELLRAEDLDLQGVRRCQRNAEIERMAAMAMSNLASEIMAHAPTLTEAPREKN